MSGVVCGSVGVWADATPEYRQVAAHRAAGAIKLFFICSSP
jgi:hypothetical protein